MSSGLEIWGRKTSSNVQCVMWAVGELGLDHERMDVGGAFGGTDTPAFLAMNPMGLVPALRDGDLSLFESCAIVRYLGARYGDGAFWPVDAAVRARLDQWAEFAKTTLAPTMIGTIFWQLVRTPAVERDREGVDRAVGSLDRLLAPVDAYLEKSDHLGGDQPCFADIVLGHLLYRYYTLDFTRPDMPALRAYYDRLAQRPAYQEHVMVDYSGLRVEGA